MPTPSPDHSLILQWIIGGVVVALYARDRFNNPEPTRATTTFWRYWSAWCGYVASMLGLFVVLGGGFIQMPPELLPFLGAEDVPILPGPLLSALMLTSLLPNIPVLSRIDAAVKDWFQRVGNIPFEVRELSGHLHEADYELRPEALKSLAQHLREFGVAPSWLRAPGGSMRRRWARSVTLYGQVRSWRRLRGYARYVEENKAALADIRARLTLLSKTFEELPLAELDREAAQSAMAHLRQKISGDISALYGLLCDFVSAGVLSVALNHAQRHAALRQLGFSGLPPARPPLSAHDVVLAMGFVFLAMLFVPMLVRGFFDPEPLAPKLRLLVMVPIIYGIAIVAAIYPKSVSPFACRQEDAYRPVAAYAFSGALAATAAFALSLLFRFAFDTPGNVIEALATPGAFGRAWGASVERAPWLLMTFFATVAIAWAADDHPSQAGPPPRWLRWAEAVTLAAIFGALQWLVLRMLPPEVAPGHPQGALLTAVVIGGSIGGFVPHLYRLRRRQETEASVQSAEPGVPVTP